MDIKQIRKINDPQEAMQACLFNLIVYTEKPCQAESFKEVVQLITKQFSCRVLFIQGNPHSKEDTLTLEMTQDNQVFIEVAGKEMARVYSLLLTLFVPDLPLYLLWGQESTAGSILLPLRPFATRLIFDSRFTSNLEHFCEEMLDLIHSASIDVIDLNWIRTMAWRDILAQIFDSPERFEQLQTAHEIKIFYRDLPNDPNIYPESRSLYLQAWLASCLKGHLKKYEEKNRHITLHYEINERAQKIHLIPQLDDNFAPEEILSIEILGEKDYTCQIKRKTIDQFDVHAHNQFQCELPLTLLVPTLRSGRNFIQEVFYQKMDPHNEPAMELIRLIKKGTNGTV